jgi:hypothetical protein
MKLKDISINVKRKSGKIIINKQIDGDNTSFKNNITLEFLSLKELDNNETEVGLKDAQIKHSLDSFQNLEFFVSFVSNIIYQNLTALSFDLQVSKIQDLSTKLSMRFIIFNQSGVINNNNESYIINPGTIKIAFDMEDWKFCSKDGLCPGVNCCINDNIKEEGKFLEFAIRIKGEENAKNRNNKSYNLGNFEMNLFENIQSDGNWTNMPFGFPRYKNNSDEYTFRFPVFNQKLSYETVFTFTDSTKVRFFYILVICFLIPFIICVSCLIKRKTNKDLSESLIY